MPNFSSLAGLEVAEKFLWGVGGVVCTVIFVSNPTVVLCCVGVGVLTMRKVRNFNVYHMALRVWLLISDKQV